MDIIETIQLLKGDRKNLLQVSLSFVQYELNSLLKDVAKIHLQSAEQAFTSATTSNAPDLEIRVGIGHLRDSFNSYQVLLEKGRIILGFLRLEWDDEIKTSIHLKLASIASVIALIYKSIGDESNYIAWKISALNAAEPYLQNRIYAIRKWESARRLDYISASGAPHFENDYEKIAKYKDELVFIDVFKKVMKDDL